ncbi:MAG TPA: hypothetical protein VMY37_30575 [Thermoguttaceae bacterium]|nr:hypothetical protein [Thermoguttaceae bacterium]
MKVAIFSESNADEVAIRILVDGILGTRTEVPSPMPPIRSRGWGAVLRDLPMALRHLHYQSDAHAMLVVLDSDRSPLHRASDCQSAKPPKKCRLCQMATILTQVQNTLAPRPTYGPLRMALGLAVPQIEAWYLAGRDPHVSEAAWMVGLQSGKPPYTGGSLKKQVYGTDEPLLEMETSRAKEEAERIVREGKLSLLEQLFPGGFGSLAGDVRSW